MNDLIDLKEDFFEYASTDGKIIPIIDLGEELEYYVTYGHIPFDEMKEHVIALLTDYGVLDDYSVENDLDDISWRWATAHTDDYGEIGLRWGNVNYDTEGAFPITLLNTW